MDLNQIIQGDCIKVVQSLPPDTIKNRDHKPALLGVKRLRND